jgi:hypothetical protein
MQDITSNGIGINTDLGPVVEATSKALPKTFAKLDDFTSSVLELIKIPVDICLYGKNVCEKKIEAKFRDKYATIPYNKRVSPPPQVLSAISNAAKVCADDEKIQEMFAELLAKACNKEYIETIHPAFIEKIKQLSPLEASLIVNNQLLSGYLPYCIVRYQQYPNKDFSIEYNEDFFQHKSTGNNVLNVYMVLEGFEDSQNAFLRINEAIDNMVTLGLITLDSTSAIKSDKAYSAFPETVYFKGLIASPSNGKQVGDEPIKRGFFLLRGCISPTSFGKAFYNIVCK